MALEAPGALPQPACRRRLVLLVPVQQGARRTEYLVGPLPQLPERSGSRHGRLTWSRRYVVSKGRADGFMGGGQLPRPGRRPRVEAEAVQG